jgi:AraC family transcriptional regulator
VINGDIRLAHLYFSPEQFALGCVTLLDREPREVQLREARSSTTRCKRGAFDR